MKFIVCPFGSYGDLNPFVGLSLALKARGHEPTLFACGYFREMIERHGLSFRELGTAEEYLKASEHPDLWHPLRGFPHIFHHGIEQIMQRQCDWICDEASRGPVTVIASCLGFGARIACEKLKIPLITVHLQPAVLFSAIAPPTMTGLIRGRWVPNWLTGLLYSLGEKLVADRAACLSINALRQANGLLPIRRITRWWHSPDCNLCLFPDWYAPKQTDWPAHSVTTNFPLWDDGDGAPLSPSIEAFLNAGERPIVFTPGSGNQLANAFFETGLQVCKKLGKRGIFLTRFPHQVPQSLDTSVQHFEYAPFGGLLPRVAAIVHHGGIGTVSQALRAGIPQLIMPLSHDQPDNAERIGRLGVGDSLSPRSFQTSRVARVLQSLLESDSVQSSCKQVASRFANLDAFEMPCRVIEAAVGGTVPLGLNAPF